MNRDPATTPWPHPDDHTEAGSVGANEPVSSASPGTGAGRADHDADGGDAGPSGPVEEGDQLEAVARPSPGDWATGAGGGYGSGSDQGRQDGGDPTDDAAAEWLRAAPGRTDR